MLSKRSFVFVALFVLIFQSNQVHAGFVQGERYYSCRTGWPGISGEFRGLDKDINASGRQACESFAQYLNSSLFNTVVSIGSPAYPTCDMYASSNGEPPTFSPTFFSCLQGTYCETSTGLVKANNVTGLCFIDDDEPPKSPPSCGGVGNPCQVSTGAKTQTETDFSSGLSFTRSYQTLNLVDVGLGKGWRSNFQQQLSISGDNLYVVEKSGRGDPWRKVNDVWESDVDSDYILAETTTGFTVTAKRGDVMEYDLEGRLLSQTDTQGKTSSYVYDNENRLTTVTNHYGVSISFVYSTDDKNHIVSVTNNGNEEYRFEYDSNDNLTAVIYPDTNTDPSDNPRKTYHYENPDFPNHLTGITDTKGNRYGTYAFDENGQAISTEHSQTTNSVGQERFQLNYGTQGAN